MATKMPRRTRKVRAVELIGRCDEILQACGAEGTDSWGGVHATHEGLSISRIGPADGAAFGTTWLLDVWDGRKVFSVRWNGTATKADYLELVRLDKGDWEERPRRGREGVVVELASQRESGQPQSSESVVRSSELAST